MVRIAKRQLEGRTHYVVPCVMMVEGVHYGSGGPLYYSNQVLKQSVIAWNGKPVVVYHPSMTQGGWASQPEIYNKQKIGTIFNTRYDNGLKCDCWIDIDRVQSVDTRVYNAIAKKQMLECSIGVGVVTDDLKGVWNNEQYQSKVLDFMPDHLALLPDQKGACSIEDGAGFIRNIRGIVDVETPLPVPVWTY